MDEQAVQKKAKEIMDSFLKAIDKVQQILGEDHKVKELRTQKPTKDPQFRKRMFANAKHVEDDYVVMEKGKWT